MGLFYAMMEIYDVGAGSEKCGEICSHHGTDIDVLVYRFGYLRIAVPAFRCMSKRNEMQGEG